jgi:hypothetical protein
VAASKGIFKALIAIQERTCSPEISMRCRLVAVLTAFSLVLSNDCLWAACPAMPLMISDTLEAQASTYDQKEYSKRLVNNLGVGKRVIVLIRANVKNKIEGKIADIKDESFLLQVGGRKSMPREIRYEEIQFIAAKGSSAPRYLIYYALLAGVTLAAIAVGFSRASKF